MIRIMIILTPRPAHSDSVSCREWGWGRAGTRAGLCQGCSAPLDPAPGDSICPQGPQALGANVVHDCLCLEPSPTGVPSEPVAAQASGLAGSSVGPGLSWRAGPLLPPVGLANALLHRAGAKQGSEGTIRWGAATLHLEVGSQGGVLARAPLGGGQGIWKESRRVALEALKGTFACGPWPAKGALGPVRKGFSTLHAFTHSHSSVHPVSHSFILQQIQIRAGLQAPQRFQSPLCYQGLPVCEERHGNPTL